MTETCAASLRFTSCRAERRAFAVGVQPGADVAHDVVWKLADSVSGDLAALVRLGDDGLAGPLAGGEEDADARESVGIGVMAQAREGQVGRIDGDAHNSSRASRAAAAGRGSPSSREPPDVPQKGGIHLLRVPPTRGIRRPVLSCWQMGDEYAASTSGANFLTTGDVQVGYSSSGFHLNRSALPGQS